MGCHTWFYRKIERTQEEAKQSCIRTLKTERSVCWKIFKNPTGYLGIDWETTKEEQLFLIKAHNRRIKAVYNNLYQRAVWNRQDDEELTFYVDGKGLFIEDTGFHDLFRVGGYPDTKLFSLEETLNYLETKSNKCSTDDMFKTIEDLKKYWEKYPDGMICFD